MNHKPWSLEDVQAWFAGRAPDGWFTDPPEVTVDGDEILGVGRVSQPKLEADGEADARQVADLSRIDGFREDTRQQRMRIDSHAERLWGRKVSWGARCGEADHQFTTHSGPVMTRLRMSERHVLDTLI